MEIWFKKPQIMANTNVEYNKGEIFVPKYVRLVYVRGAQIAGTSKSGTLNFVEWCQYL